MSPHRRRPRPILLGDCARHCQSTLYPTPDQQEEDLPQETFNVLHLVMLLSLLLKLSVLFRLLSGGHSDLLGEAVIFTSFADTDMLFLAVFPRKAARPYDPVVFPCGSCDEIVLRLAQLQARDLTLTVLLVGLVLGHFNLVDVDEAGVDGHVFLFVLLHRVAVLVGGLGLRDLHPASRLLLRQVQIGLVPLQPHLVRVVLVLAGGGGGRGVTSRRGSAPGGGRGTAVSGILEGVLQGQFSLFLGVEGRGGRDVGGLFRR